MAEGDPNYRRARVAHGRSDLTRDEGGVWRITWAPDEGHPDRPGRTYSPDDADLPADHPGASDPDALLRWGPTALGESLNASGGKRVPHVPPRLSVPVPPTAELHDFMKEKPPPADLPQFARTATRRFGPRDSARACAATNVID